MKNEGAQMYEDIRYRVRAVEVSGRVQERIFINKHAACEWMAALVIALPDTADITFKRIRV